MVFVCTSARADALSAARINKQRRLLVGAIILSINVQRWRIGCFHALAAKFVEHAFDIANERRTKRPTCRDVVMRMQVTQVLALNFPPQGDVESIIQKGNGRRKGGAPVRTSGSRSE